MQFVLLAKPFFIPIALLYASLVESPIKPHTLRATEMSVVIAVTNESSKCTQDGDCSFRIENLHMPLVHSTLELASIGSRVVLMFP